MDGVHDLEQINRTTEEAGVRCYLSDPIVETPSKYGQKMTLGTGR